MKKIFLSIILVISFGCKKNKPQSEPVKNDSVSNTTVVENKISANSADKNEDLRIMNDEILLALKNKDYKTFADFIHPEKGIRFSMYAFVDPKGDKQFSRSDFEKYQPAKTIFTWGTKDGSGDLHKATLNEYLNNWVFVKDFTKSNFSLNEFQGGGNSLNNLKEIYPNTNFTENFVKGTEQYGEMDWKTLRFVFEQFEGKYYLVAVINDQWTI